MTHGVRTVRRAHAGLGFAVLAAVSFGLSGALAAGLLDAGWSPAALVTCRLGRRCRRARRSCAGRPAGSLASPPRERRVPARLRAGRRCRCASSPYFSAIDRLPIAIAILIEYAAPVAVVGWLWARHRQTPTRLTVAGAARRDRGARCSCSTSSRSGPSTVSACSGRSAAWSAARSSSSCPRVRTTACRRSSWPPEDWSSARSRSAWPGCSGSSTWPPAPVTRRTTA